MPKIEVVIPFLDFIYLNNRGINFLKDSLGSLLIYFEKTNKYENVKIFDLFVDNKIPILDRDSKIYTDKVAALYINEEVSCDLKLREDKFPFFRRAIWIQDIMEKYVFFSPFVKWLSCKETYERNGFHQIFDFYESLSPFFKVQDYYQDYVDVNNFFENIKKSLEKSFIMDSYRFSELQIFYLEIPEVLKPVHFLKESLDLFNFRTKISFFYSPNNLDVIEVKLPTIVEYSFNEIKSFIRREKEIEKVIRIQNVIVDSSQDNKASLQVHNYIDKPFVLIDGYENKHQEIVDLMLDNYKDTLVFFRKDIAIFTDKDIIISNDYQLRRACEEKDYNEYILNYIKNDISKVFFNDEERITKLFTSLCTRGTYYNYEPDYSGWIDYAWKLVADFIRWVLKTITTWIFGERFANWWFDEEWWFGKSKESSKILESKKLREPRVVKPIKSYKSDKSK